MTKIIKIQIWVSLHLKLLPNEHIVVAYPGRFSVFTYDFGALKDDVVLVAVLYAHFTQFLLKPDKTFTKVQERI